MISPKHTRTNGSMLLSILSRSADGFDETDNEKLKRVLSGSRDHSIAFLSAHNLGVLFEFQTPISFLFVGLFVCFIYFFERGL